MKRHIEFLGLPGSGKTTLASKLCACLERNNHTALLAERALYVALQRRAHYYEMRYPIKYCSYKRGKRWLYEVCCQPRFSYDPLNRFLGAHGEMTETLRALQRRPESIQGCAVLIKWLVRLYSGYQLAKENLKQDEMLVLDEGFCNRALSIFGYGSAPLDPENLQDYIMGVPAPDVVIYVEAAAATREKRLSTRGYPKRFKGLSAAQRTQLHRNFETCISIVSAGLQTRGIPVVCINNEDTLEGGLEPEGMLNRILKKADILAL